MSATLVTAGPLFGAHLALKARLEAFFPPSQFAHGVVPARLSPQGWQRLLHRTPFVGIGWGGLAPDKASGRWLRGDMQWTVFLAARSTHAPETRLLGSPQSPGIYGMVQVAAAALHGFTIKGEAHPDSGAVGTVAVGDVANLTVDGWEDEATVMAGLSVTVGFGLADGVSVAALDEFLRLGATWEFDPGAVGAATDTYDTRSS